MQLIGMVQQPSIYVVFIMIIYYISGDYMLLFTGILQLQVCWKMQVPRGWILSKISKIRWKVSLILFLATTILCYFDQSVI